MGYSTIAQSIRSKASLLGEAISSIEDISFDATWAGSAHDNMVNNLETSISSLKKEKDNANIFADALEDLQIYKDNKEKITDFKNTLNGIPNTEENKDVRVKYSNQIEGLLTTNENLKKSIEVTLYSIASVGTIFELVKYEPTTDYQEYVVDLDELTLQFESGTFASSNSSSKTGNSLYDYYTEAEIDSMLTSIKKQYSGRDAAVNCALGVMQMAADVGLKLNYDWGMSHALVTDADAVASGGDSSSFASWAINQGTNGNFNSRCTDSLEYVGEKVSYEDAQKGDILVYNSGGSGRVVMIVDNNPETQQFLVAEANDEDDGVIVQKKSYASLSGTYQARDLSNIYNV